MNGEEKRPARAASREPKLDPRAQLRDRARVVGGGVALFAVVHGDLSIKQLEETIGLSLLLIVELAPADLNGSAELKRVAEAQRALQIFSRELFRAPPDKAREFADGLAGLSWWDKDDGDRIDRHLALWIRRLSARIGLHRDYLTLAHKYIPFGRGVEHRAIGLIAEFGCRLYWRVHGNVPAPRKTGNQPGGPFDKFMYAMLEPIAGKMRKNGRRYGWPTIMKHVERARRNLRPSQSA